MSLLKLQKKFTFEIIQKSAKKIEIADFLSPLSR